MSVFDLLESSFSSLSKKEEIIQMMLSLEREVVVNSAKAISLFVSFSDGREYVEKAESIFSKLSTFPYRLDYRYIIESEIVEAKFVGFFLMNYEFDFSHSSEAVVRGFLDSFGELYRAFLFKMKEKEYGKALEILKKMEENYAYVEGFMFSDAVLRDFKRKKDVALSLLQRAQELYISVVSKK